MIRQATDEAEEKLNQARQAGFYQGLVAAAQEVAGYIGNGQQLQQTLREHLDEHVHTMLSSVLNRPEIIQALLNEWLDSLPEGKTDEPLQLILPESARQFHSRLKETLNLRTMTAKIHYHAESPIRMKYAGEVAEFTLQESIDTAIIRLNELPSPTGQCKELAEATLRRLAQIFTHQVTPGSRDKETQHDLS